MDVQPWVPVLCYAALGFLKVDYGWKGLTFFIVLYLARETRSGLCAAFLAYALFWGTGSSMIRSIFGIPLSVASIAGIGPVISAFFRLQGMIWLALPLIAIPTHSGMRIPKWMGYGLYPLHLVLLIILKLMNGFTVEMLLQGF